MIRIVTSDNADHHAGLLRAMYRMRKSAFQDRLGWEVAATGDSEIDAFDALDPVYVLSIAPDGSLAGCVRLLPTRGPNMLRDVFPSLLVERGIPCGDTLWEASRFVIARHAPRGEAGLAQATYELLTGMLNVCLGRGIGAVVCVVDLRMERILRRAGWPLWRLGNPRRIGVTTAVAGRLEVSTRILHEIADRAGWRRPLAV